MNVNQLSIFVLGACLACAQELPGTMPLTDRGDMAALMLDGMHTWLDRALVEGSQRRNVTGVPMARADLRRMLGIHGERVAFDRLEQRSGGVWWPVLREARAELDGEGALLRPKSPARCYVVAIPDADETPDLTEAARLADGGCLVVAPVLISCGTGWSWELGVKTTHQTRREFAHRMAYQMGRHVLGYEVEKVRALVDWMARQEPKAPIGVYGRGEGALIALYAGALDERIDVVGVNGLESVEQTWSQPLYRNIFGLLKSFGDAELAALVQPRRLVRGDDALNEFARALGTKTGAAWMEWRDDGAGERLQRQFSQMIEFTQALVRASDGERKQFWSAYKPTDPVTLEPYLERFADWIGRLPRGISTAPVESRQSYDTKAFRGYEVKLPVMGEVFGYGILLIPKDLKPGERRPLVVAQHGLEGRPQILVDAGTDEKGRDTYQEFAARLAERGYIVYAPQNPYILGERFRTIQRKANPLGLTLFSFVVAQHARTLDWLKTLPMVDSDRIGFYGLSYGGFTAMRVPVLLQDYKVVICSGNFNEWTWKTTSVDAPYSYMFTREYEIPEFDQGAKFGHFEMARMIAPRPFMVERGHRDGVGVDEWVAYEYAKVARHYQELGIAERVQIEYFDGVHRINGDGTFRFLDRWLNWTPR